MVRFSCFQGHVHSTKHKKTAQLSSEAMHKTLEDSSQNQASKNLSYLTTENKPCLKEEEGDIHNNNIADHDHVTDYSTTERDCRSEEMEGKYSTDCDSVVHKTAQLKKSHSLGSGLNWEGRNGSEDEIEQRFSYDGSASRSGLVAPDGTNTPQLSLSDQFQEPLPSDSVQVDSDVAKNVSIFSIGDPQQTEKESPDRDDICLSGKVDFGDFTSPIRPVMIKSSSLSRIDSPGRCSSSFLRHVRSADDLNTLDSGKNEVAGGQTQYHQQRENSMFRNDKNNQAESPANETDEAYNYVASAKDWIIPASDGANMEEEIKGETSFNHMDENMPTHDFRLKRIEDWVMNLQHCGTLEESEESDPCYEQELSSKGNALLEEPAALKSEVKVNPGMETAKRYISSLNAAATAAQLTNLGLVVIPFLSAFGSLKALNLSGNAIVRIAAGALPRGLHILNLSKNNIATIEGLRDLTRLRVLDLSYNRILRIGHGLAACSSLKELYLAGNKISEVEGLHRLLKLTVLDLRFNKISTTKCLGQLAANYNCLHALSVEGNPAQKNVGDEQLKKYVQSLLPNLTYYNRQSIKVGSVKDGSDRSARLSIGSHQIDRGLRSEGKTMRKGTHGIVSQKVPSSSSHGRRSQGVASPKTTRDRHGHAHAHGHGHGHGHGHAQGHGHGHGHGGHGGRLPPTGMKTSIQGQQFAGMSNKLLSLRNELSFSRSRSEGNLGAI